LKILDTPNLKWWGPWGQVIPYVSFELVICQREKRETGLPCGGCKLLWKSSCELHHSQCRHLPYNRINVYVKILLTIVGLWNLY
jgi:hypothetical protein